MSKKKQVPTSSEKASEEKSSTSQNPKKDHRNIIIIALMFLSLFSIGAAAYFYYQNTQLHKDIEDLDIQVTTLNTQVRKLQNEISEDNVGLEDGSCQQEGESCGGMPTADGSFIQCCSGLICDYSNVDPNIADAPGRCVVDEENKENESQDDGGSALEEAREDFTRYVIYNRKIVERELPDGAPLFAWDVVKTFEMEYPVERLYVNPSETDFVFGVYKGDAIYGDGMPGETWYYWYHYNIETGKTLELTGLQFENFDIEGNIQKVNNVYGWVSNNEVSLGDSGMYDLNGIAIYNIDTREIASYSQEEWDKYEIVGY